jgi:ribosomal protein S18 acetylase RimI-like enzyme
LLCARASDDTVGNKCLLFLVEGWNNSTTMGSMHPLDNIIWNALTTRQTEFAESSGDARRFMPEVTALGAFREATQEGYESLAGLVDDRGTVALFLDEAYEERKGWEIVAGAPLLQMVGEPGDRLTAKSEATVLRTADSREPALSLPKGRLSLQEPMATASTDIVRLGNEDSSEMIALTALTKPGPFGKRTHELGNYFGIRCEGRLVAMAGERMKVPGWTEVSAVCTHPQHAGHGYAGILMKQVMHGIWERGETPMLHVREDNARAVEVYKRLGFGTRVRRHFAVIRKTG